VGKRHRRFRHRSAPTVTTILTLPKLGDTPDAVVLLEWLVDPGEHVGQGEPLARVETAKVEVEIPAPTGGTVVTLFANVDDEIAVGAPLVEIEPD
jgi:pyruvate/2-oxoglutarate dehydrogenase complex dihydrolipoamide acyltransferase (E2) component